MGSQAKSVVSATCQTGGKELFTWAKSVLDIHQQPLLLSRSNRSHSLATYLLTDDMILLVGCRLF